VVGFETAIDFCDFFDAASPGTDSACRGFGVGEGVEITEESFIWWCPAKWGTPILP